MNPPQLLKRLASLAHNWLPSRGSVLFTLLVAGGLLLYAQRVGALPGSIPAQSQSATSISTLPYQGRLTDSDGNPVNDTVAATFRLYAAASGGTVLWQEVWSTVEVSEGLFNVLLGSTTPLTQTLFTENDSLWLGISVEADTEMTPRVQVGSVPFAVQALTVPAGSITSDKLALQSGSVCLGTDTIVPVQANYIQSVIPGMSIQFTLTTAGKVLIWTSGIYHFDSSTSYVGTAVYLDGSQVVQTSEVMLDTAWHNFALVRQVAFDAGAHTLDLRTFAQNEGAVTYAGGELTTCLEFVVLN